MKLTKSKLRQIIQEEKQKLLKEVSQSKIETFTNAAWDIAGDMSDAGREWEGVRSYLIDEVNGVIDSLMQEEGEALSP
jgi:hypothetical protein